MRVLFRVAATLVIAIPVLLFFISILAFNARRDPVPAPEGEESGSLEAQAAWL